MRPDDYSEGQPPGPDGAADDPDLSFDDGATLQVDASAGAGERVDRYLVEALAARVPGASRTRIQQWIALGAVWCDERALQPSTRLTGFEVIRVQPLPREAERAFEPDPVPLAVVAEDRDLLVIDKPSGLVMHPAAGNWRGTLLNGLLHRDPSLAHLPRAGIVHRLDKDTSGLLVVARNEAAMASLVEQLVRRSVSRRYLAFALGEVPAEGSVDAPIGRDPRVRTRMAVVAGAGGKPARTHFTRLALVAVGGSTASLIECRLETGRTHQIRVHLRHLGHPLLGDALYGGPTTAIGRQALHAWRLGLTHPRTGSLCHWSSVPPPDLRTLAESAGLDLAVICRELDESIDA